jgi:C1A family cysteine protease
MLSPIKTEVSNSTGSLVNSSDCNPTFIDWRNEIAVNKIKDQGRFCSSGWAFSTVAALEGRYRIKTGTLYTLSEQMLMDCNCKYGNWGCEGGKPTDSFNFARDLGMTNEADYPYVAVKKECSYDPKKLAQPTGYTDVIPYSALELKAAIASGPVAVAI